MIENNQFVFAVNEIIDRHNRHAVNKIVKIYRRRKINFNISQNDENNIDSNSNFLHVEISIKRVLQNIIVAINNQLAKKNISETRKTNRVSIYCRELISVFFHMFLNVLFLSFYFFETLNAHLHELLNEMLFERRERSKRS